MGIKPRKRGNCTMNEIHPAVLKWLETCEIYGFNSKSMTRIRKNAKGRIIHYCDKWMDKLNEATRMRYLAALMEVRAKVDGICGDPEVLARYLDAHPCVTDVDKGEPPKTPGEYFERDKECRVMGFLAVLVPLEDGKSCWLYHAPEDWGELVAVIIDEEEKRIEAENLARDKRTRYERMMSFPEPPAPVMATPATPAPAPADQPQAVDGNAMKIAQATNGDVSGSLIDLRTEQEAYISVRGAMATVYFLDHGVVAGKKQSNEIDNLKKAYRQSGEIPKKAFEQSGKEFFNCKELFVSICHWHNTFDPAKAMKIAPTVAKKVDFCTNSPVGLN